MIKILNEEKLSDGQKRYWLSAKLSNRLTLAGVTVIDPFRMHLKTLRETHKGETVYRASTGGKWGRSAQIVRL